MLPVTKEKDDRKMLRDTIESCTEEAQPNSMVENLLSTNVESSMPNDQNVQTLKVFVATWNVGGKSPRGELNLDDFLHLHDQSDIYVIGFQEIVPLNAGNVLVIEDNEPAARWLALIYQSLNKLDDVASKGLKCTVGLGGSLFFQKPSLKKISKSFRTESKRRLKMCNCTAEHERRNSIDFCFPCPQSYSYMSEDDFSSDEDEDAADASELVEVPTPTSTNQINYSLIASKQMVGIFVSVWARKELVQHVAHLRISCISRGIMGRLGNKGCISVRMTIYQTSFCFVCSHLASGEKEGDELRRNFDVIEILRNTQFSRICRTLNSKVPEKIVEHDRIIWFGDLNYRIALSYQDARTLLEKNDWDALLDKDQLKIEQEAGRVFNGWMEGRIYFAPTYKYSYNSDSYASEAINAKKRRTPAWCDRILWHGNGIRQLSYVRGESRFSDHRPVCAKFLVDVMVGETTKRASNTFTKLKVGAEELFSASSYCVFMNPVSESAESGVEL